MSVRNCMRFWRQSAPNVTSEGAEEPRDARLAQAAEALLPDYTADAELTSFTALDTEPFHAQG